MKIMTTRKLMIDSFQNFLCEAVAKAYVYESIKEYTRQVDVKPLVLTATGLDKS